MTAEQLANVGAWCSIFGLLFGIAGVCVAAWAARSAQGAKEAAREAAQNARAQSVAETLGRLHRLAEHALRAVEQADAGALEFSVSELRTELPVLCARHAPAARAALCQPLLKSRQYASYMRRLLAERGREAERDDRLRTYASACVSSLAEALGAAQAETDEGRVEGSR